MEGFGVQSSNPNNSQAGLGGQDTTQLLQKMLFGRTVGAWDKTRTQTFTANFEPRFTWPAGVKTQITPPQGTPCLMVFAANADHTPWITAFGNWP